MISSIFIAFLLLLFAEFPDDQAGIVSAKAQGIADGNIHIHGNAVSRRIIQVAPFSRFFQANGCMYVSVLDGLDAGNEFHAACCAQKMAQSDAYDAVICLGAVIRGTTSHYDLVCNEVAKGVAQVGLKTGKPVMFGVVTTDTIEQAIERAGTKAGNKGFDCAVGAIEMVNLLAAVGE